MPVMIGPDYLSALTHTGVFRMALQFPRPRRWLIHKWRVPAAPSPYDRISVFGGRLGATQHGRVRILPRLTLPCGPGPDAADRSHAGMGTALPTSALPALIVVPGCSAAHAPGRGSERQREAAKTHKSRTLTGPAGQPQRQEDARTRRQHVVWPAADSARPAGPAEHRRGHVKPRPLAKHQRSRWASTAPRSSCASSAETGSLAIFV